MFEPLFSRFLRSLGFLKVSLPFSLSLLSEFRYDGLGEGLSEDGSLVPGLVG